MMLTLTDIWVKYGAIEAIRGVSLDLSRGETVTVIGANGAGKTTIIKAIMGIAKVARGTIHLASAGEIQNLPAHKIPRLGIGYVPEGREILTRLTVEDNLTIGGYVLQTKRELLKRREYIYEKFATLRSRRRQMGHSLSGGEQQMLAIARALMFSPKILLMDEPSLGLAPIIVNQVFTLIGDLREEGFSILLIEQNARKALQISQRGYILESGSVVAADESQNLIRNEEIKKAYLGG